MFNLTPPADEARLRAEVEQFEKNRIRSIDREIEGAAAAATAGNQASAEQEDEFLAFHKVQVGSRAFRRFLVLHPWYRNCGENTQVMDRYIRDNFNNEVTAESIQTAFDALSAAGKLLLTDTKTKGTSLQESLESRSAQQIYDAYEAAKEAAEKEELEDRAMFEKAGVGGTRAAIKFTITHPDFVQCPQNSAALQLWFSNHRIDPNRASLEQFNDAYQELVASGSLELKPSKARPVQSAADDFDPETCPLEELEKRAGGRQTNGRVIEPDTYVPDPNVRYRIGSQF